MLRRPTLGLAQAPDPHFGGAGKAKSSFPLTLLPPEQETPLDSDGWEPATGEKGISLCGGVCLSASLTLIECPIKTR